MKKLIFLFFAFLILMPFGYAQPKYVFLFIGDGMGAAQIQHAEFEAKKNGDTLCFETFPVVGMIKTSSANRKVTCSSAAGTALATGNKTNNNVLGLSPDYTIKYRKITQDMKRAGYQIGIATSVSLDHATPAAFYATAKSREDYYEIASQIPATRFDYFAGAGFIESAPDSLTSLETIFKKGKYHVSHTIEECLASKNRYNILIQPTGKSVYNIPYFIKKEKNDFTLEALTATGIARFGTRPYFFMVESGLIDWAAHDNFLDEMTGEVYALSNAVELALEVYNQYPEETLIIVTADHETGGLVINEKETKFTTDDHTAVPVPIFAIGKGSEVFAGYYDNTELITKLRSLVLLPIITH